MGSTLESTPADRDTPRATAVDELRDVFSKKIIGREPGIDWQALDAQSAESETARRRLHEVVEVSAPAEARVARLMDERGLTREQAWSDVDSDAWHAPDLVVDVISLANDGDRDQLTQAVREYWQDHVAPVLERLAAEDGASESV